MSEYTDSTMTFVIESLDGEALDPGEIKKALQGVAKVRGHRGGDHLIAKAATMRMLDSAKDAARFVGVDPDAA